MTSPLDRLVGVSLEAEPPDEKEFAGLKSSGLARLKDATNVANSLEGRFDLAYNAERIVTDLIVACQAVAAKIEALPPLP